MGLELRPRRTGARSLALKSNDLDQRIGFTGPRRWTGPGANRWIPGTCPDWPSPAVGGWWTWLRR